MAVVTTLIPEQIHTPSDADVDAALAHDLQRVPFALRESLRRDAYNDATSRRWQKTLSTFAAYDLEKLHMAAVEAAEYRASVARLLPNSLSQTVSHDGDTPAEIATKAAAVSALVAAQRANEPSWFDKATTTIRDGINSFVTTVENAYDSTKKAIEGAVTTTINQAEVLAKGFYDISASLEGKASNILSGGSLFQTGKQEVTARIGKAGTSNAANVQVLSMPNAGMSFAAPVVAPAIPRENLLSVNVEKAHVNSFAPTSHEITDTKIVVRSLARGLTPHNDNDTFVHNGLGAGVVVVSMLGARIEVAQRNATAASRQTTFGLSPFGQSPAMSVRVLAAH